MAGSEELARWRQIGAWWEVGPAFEVVRSRDGTGIVRESITELPPICDPSKLTIKSYEAYHREDVDHRLRPRKRRDEKVAKACGLLEEPPPVHRRQAELPYVPLHVLSGYSFGRSVLLAEEIPRLAAAAGLTAVAITDDFALTGAFEVVKQARKVGVKPLVGARIELPEGGSIVLMARSRLGWRSLSRLITECHLGEERLFPLATWERLERHPEGLLCLTGGDLGPLDRLIVGRRYDQAERLVDRIVNLYGRDQVFVEIDRSFLPWGMQAERGLKELAAHKNLPCVAGGAVTHRRRGHFPAQDVLACFRTLCRVDEVVGRKPLRSDGQPHPQLPPFRAFNAERFFKTAPEMQELYAMMPRTFWR